MAHIILILSTVPTPACMAQDAPEELWINVLDRTRLTGKNIVASWRTGTRC